MKKILSLSLVSILALLVSVSCFAHLKLGDYRGTDATGAACGFKVVKVEYAYGRPHPLNERVHIEAQGTSFVLSHLPLLDAGKGQVRFERDRLTGVQGTEAGGLAAVLGMSHAPGQDGPTELTVVAHDYDDERGNAKSICSNLAHQER